MEFLILGPNEELLTTLDEDLVVSAKQTEAINGAHLFEISVTGTDEKAIHLKEGNLVAFEDIEGDFQLYEVVQVTDIHGDGSAKQAVCEHANLELLDEHIEDIRPTNQTARHALTQALAGTRWQVGAVADLGIASTNFYRVNPKEAITKIIESWGGEVRYRVIIDENRITGRFVDLLARRGADTGKVYERGKDLLEITRAIDITSIKTAVRGYGKGEEIGQGYSRRITFRDVEWKVSNGDPIDKPKGQDWIGDETAKEAWGRPGAGGSRRHRFGQFEDSDEESPVRLLEKTYAYLQTVNQPVANYQGRVVDLFRLKGEDYRHERAALGDTAAVLDDEVAPVIEAKARIIELIRDLLNPGYDEAILGQYLPLNADHDAEIDKIIGKVKDNSGVWDNPDLEVRPDKYPNIKPSKPIVRLEESFETIQLYWDFVEGEYYTQTFEVYASEVQGFTTHPESLVFKGLSNSYGFVGQTNKQYYFRVRAINFSGTASDFSEEMTGNTVRIISDDILFGPEVAAELRELSKTAELLAEGSVSIEQMKEEALAKIQETAKQYTDAEMKEANEGINQDLAKKAGISYVDGKFSTANSNLQNAVTNINLSLAEKAGLNYVDGKFSWIDSDLESMLGDINLINGDVSDITTRVESLQTVSRDLQSSVAMNEQELSANGGRMTTIETDVNELEGTMLTTITQLSNVENTITDQQTKIEANASAISLKASQASLNTLSGEVNDINAELSVQAGQIELKAESSALTSVDNKVAGVRNDLSTLQVSVSGISSSVSSLRSDLNVLEIGARNLVVNSAQGWRSSGYLVMRGFLSENWVPGETYTISIKGTINEGQHFGLWRDRGSRSVKSTIPFIPAKGLFVWTFVCPSEYPGHTYFDEFSIYNYPSVGAEDSEILWVKIEKGNKATDWTPAPEDVDSSIRSVQEYASGIDQKADSITLSVMALNQNVEGNKTSISNAQSSITQLSNSVALKAEQTLVESIAGEVSSVKSDISSLSVGVNSITSSVSSLRNDLDGLAIDTRNHVFNSAKLEASSLNMKPGSRGEYRSINLGQSYTDIPHGTEVTISFDLEMVVNSANPAILIYNTNNPGPKTFVSKTLRFVAAVGEVIKGRYHIVTIVSDRVNPGRADNFMEFYTTYDTSNFFKISKIKMTKGNRATEWTPAPEDTDERIEHVQQLVSSVDQKADSIISTVSALTKTIDGHTSSITRAESSITQLSNSIALKAEQTVVESIAGEVSSVSQQVASLSVGIDGIKTEVSKKVSQTDVDTSIATSKSVKDTRDTNEAPQFYWNNYKRQTVEEFKRRTVLGISGSASYGYLTTDVPWSDSSGGSIIQRFASVDGTFERRSSSTLAWTSWLQVENTVSSQEKVDALKRAEVDPLKGRVASTETSITQLAESIDLKASQTSVNDLTGRMSQAESSLSVQAGQIATRVEKNGVVSAINQTAEQVKINAGMIDLVGDVYITNGRTYISDLAVGSAAIANGAITRAKLGTAIIGTAQIEDAAITSAKILSLNADKINASSLSAISANLGSITSGSITTLQMKGTNSQIYFGSSPSNYEGRIDYSGDGMRLQRDDYTYVKVNSGGSGGTGTYVNSMVQFYASGFPMFNFGYDGGSQKHRLMGAGNISLKFLNGDTVQMQVRNRADTSYAEVGASNFITASSREYKMNIETLDISGLDVINGLTAVTYDLIDDIENGRLNNRQTGFISEDSRAIATPDGKAISIYKLGTLSAKAIQELTDLYYDQDQRINKLELENQLLKARVSALEPCA